MSVLFTNGPWPDLCIIITNCFSCNYYCQHNVKAIVDWKWTKNGDPLTDVANFTMMFLQPEAVDDRFSVLAGHELLLGKHVMLVIV